MKNYVRAVIVGIGLTFVMSCSNGKEEADKKAVEASREAQEAANKAALKKAEADEAAAKAKAAHFDDRTKLQKELDAHDRKATYLKEKAAKATGETKKNADAAIAELETRRNTAKTSLAKLGDDAAPNWDALKKTTEDDVAAVGKAVDSLETTVTKK